MLFFLIIVSLVLPWLKVTISEIESFPITKTGRGIPESATLLANKVYQSTIDHWLHHYKQSGSICVKPKSGR